jgi:hypothetical protein
MALTGNSMDVCTFGSGFQIVEVQCDNCEDYFWIESSQVKLYPSFKAKKDQFVRCPYGCKRKVKL